MSTWRSFRQPVPPHPFAHAVEGEGWVFLSGIGGHHPDGSIDAGLEQQIRVAFATMSALLEMAGSSLSELVTLRPMVTSRAHLDGLNACLEELLPPVRPAAPALLVVELADPRMHVEFEATAFRGARLQEAQDAQTTPLR